jgi:hypothetical protein
MRTRAKVRFFDDPGLPRVFDFTEGDMLRLFSSAQLAKIGRATIRAARRDGICLRRADFFARPDSDDLVHGFVIGVRRVNAMLQEADRRGDLWESYACMVRLWGLFFHCMRRRRSSS